jgi:hypothetical protein
MPIDSTHPQYDQYKKMIEFLSASYEGKKSWYPYEQYGNINSTQVTDTSVDSSNGYVWLRNIFLPPEHRESPEKYYGRLKRSRYKKLFEKTVNNFAGLLSQFSIKPDTLNWYSQEQKEAILNNIDLRGTSLQQFLVDADISALTKGFCAIIVDYSRSGDASKKRPFLTRVDREDITNPSTIFQNDGSLAVDRLVIKRSYYRQDESDEYKLKLTDQFVEFTPGRFQVWEKVDGTLTLVDEGDTSLPIIPVIFYPNNCNNPLEIEPPLLGIAEANLSHYRLHTDYLESLHYQAPLYVRTGVANTSDHTILKPLLISPHTVVDLASDQTLQILETTGNAIGLKKESYEEVEREIAQESLNFLGSEQSMTATEANIRGTVSRANLSLYGSDKMSAVNEIFTLWALWEGKKPPSDQGITIKEGYWMGLTPDMIRVLTELFTLGALDVENLWAILGNSGALPSVDIAAILEKVQGNQGE